MNFYGADSADIAMLCFFTVAGLLFIGIGIYSTYHISATGWILVFFMIATGTMFVAAAQLTITADIIRSYRNEIKRRQREDITRDEPWTEECI